MPAWGGQLMAILVRYDDPEFSKRYDLSVTDTTDPLLARREAAANAWNREFAPSTAPLSKYKATDAHIVRMADLYSRVIG
jgi:hypothetical protein